MRLPNDGLSSQPTSLGLAFSWICRMLLIHSFYYRGNAQMFKGNNLPLSECLGRNTVMKTYSHKSQQSKLYFFLINHNANYSHSCFRKKTTTIRDTESAGLFNVRMRVSNKSKIN